jgi:hypothetical protein
MADPISPELKKDALARIGALRKAVRKLDAAVDHMAGQASAMHPDPAKLEVTLNSMKAPIANIIENYLVLRQKLVSPLDAQLAWSEVRTVGEANSKVTVKDLGIDPSLILPGRGGIGGFDPWGRGGRGF